jgi:hypothetical protein
MRWRDVVLAAGISHHEVEPSGSTSALSPGRVSLGRWNWFAIWSSIAAHGLAFVVRETCWMVNPEGFATWSGLTNGVSRPGWRLSLLYLNTLFATEYIQDQTISLSGPRSSCKWGRDRISFCSRSPSFTLPGRAGTSHSFTMSCCPRYPSSHSREGSRQGESCLPITKAALHDLQRNKTTIGTPHPVSSTPSYPAAGFQQPPVSYRATGFAAPFLPTGYDSSNYSRSSSSSERLAPPRHAGALSAFGIADSDPVNFSLDPDAAGLKVPPSLSDSNLVAQAEMR